MHNGSIVYDNIMAYMYVYHYNKINILINTVWVTKTVMSFLTIVDTRCKVQMSRYQLHYCTDLFT